MTTIHSFMRAADWSLSAVTQSFAPSPAATSRSIRINGAVCILFGMICSVAFGAAIFLLKAPNGLLLIPSFLAYAFFTVGGYRLIRGKEAVAQYPGEISFSRIALGCLSVAFCSGLLIGVVWIASLLFEK
jgi:hypothetical protein